MGLREKIRRAKEAREAANEGKEPPFGFPPNPVRPSLGHRCPACGAPRPKRRWPAQ